MDKYDKQFDDFLCIRTMEDMVEDIEQKLDETGDSLYQATYYKDLVKLFNEVPMEPEVWAEYFSMQITVITARPPV